MKQKKVLSRLISAFVAVIMLIGIMPIISSADDGVILSYTFDSQELVKNGEKRFEFSDANEVDLYSYDGKTFSVNGQTWPMPFLCGTYGQSVWSVGPGWFNYDTERNGVSAGVPTVKEMYIDGGKLHVNLAVNNYMNIRIPNVDSAGTCKITLDISDVSGNGLLIQTDNVNGSKTLVCDKSANGSYEAVVNFQSGDFLRISNTTDGNLSFAIDNLLIQKYGASAATVASSVPANGTKNVSTFIKPQITFSDAITADVASSIEVYADGTKINATVALSNENKTATVTPASVLPGNTTIEIRIPGNSPVTFTTDDSGVILHYTFDTSSSKTYIYSTSKECTLFTFDGKEHPFLNYCGNTCVNWHMGWISGNTDTDNIPSKENMDIKDGKLSLKFNGNINIKIPDCAIADKTYSVEFKVDNLKGSFGNVLVDNFGGRGVYRQVYLSSATADGVTTYKGIYTCKDSKDFLQIQSSGNVSCNLDDLIIKEYVTSPANIASTFPEQNRENVPTYVNPTVTFDDAVTTDYANGIKVLNGTDEIATTKTLSADGKTVTLKTASQLPANSLITVKADDNNSFTFKTGDRNVALFEDFETGTNDDANLGTIYGVRNVWGCEGFELTHCEQLGSRAIKFTFKPWGSASIKLSPKVFGDDVNRRFKVSFDYYTDGSSVEAKLDGTGYNGGTMFIPTLTKGKKQHTETVVGAQNLSSYGAILFANSTGTGGNVTLYIDNIRVEDITENAWADIVWYEGNSLIMASSSTEKTNHMWTGMNGKTLTAKYNNLTDGTYKGYIAVYSGDTLVGASAADITVANGATNDTVVITLPAEGDTGAFSVKAFLWNSEMTPIIEPTVLYNVK